MSRGILGIDIGTGSTKAVVLDAGGRQLSVAACAHPIEHPRRGWAETDPEEWWSSARRAVGEAVTAAGVEICSVGLCGQMHGAVLTRADGFALRPAVLWADQRAETQLAHYRRLPANVAGVLGNPLVAGMTGPILYWLAEHETPVYQQADWVMQAKDWLRLRLVGVAASEPSDASATLLYDLAGRRWAAGVINNLGLRPEILAPIGVSGELAGLLTAEAAQEFGLDAGLPVGLGAGDTAAALVGTRMVEPGLLQLTVGTGAQVAAIRRDPKPDGKRRYHVFASALPDQFYAMSAIQAAGLAFEWAWSALGCDWPTAYAAMARSAPGASGVSFIPHLAGARSPSMNPRATGAFIGLEMRHGRDDLIRSVFEGIAFSIREAAAALPEFEGSSDIRLAGGGSASRAWRQLLADVLNHPLVIVEAQNASSRGAALLGGMAGGIVHELPAAEAEPAATAVCLPQTHIGAINDAYALWLSREAELFAEAQIDKPPEA
ncbi:MAG: xylulokinase [Actinomycetes bacterium]